MTPLPLSPPPPFVMGMCHICFVMPSICLGKHVETHISHYIKYVAPNYKTIIFSKMGKPHSAIHVGAHCFVRRSCHCFHTTYLAHILFKVRQDVGAQVRRLVDYAYFAQTSSRASHFVTVCCLRTHMNLFSAHYESDILNSMHIM